MTLEYYSQVASIVSAITGLIGLFGLGLLVHKVVFKHENSNSVIVHGDFNGDVVNKGTIKATSKSNSSHD